MLNNPQNRLICATLRLVVLATLFAGAVLAQGSGTVEATRCPSNSPDCVQAVDPGAAQPIQPIGGMTACIDAETHMPIACPPVDAMAVPANPAAHVQAKPAKQPAEFGSKQAKAIVKHYQKVLQLEDWSILIHFETFEGLESLIKLRKHDPDAEGAAFSIPDMTLKTFHIFLPYPSEYGKLTADEDIEPMTPKEIVMDLRNSILHELIHLELIPLMLADDAHLMDTNEATVVGLARAFELAEGIRK